MSSYDYNGCNDDDDDDGNGKIQLVLTMMMMRLNNSLIWPQIDLCPPKLPNGAIL